MDLADFDYELPAGLIAQEPAKQRDQSRLLRVGRGDASCSHHRFSDLPDLLPKDCVLICNNTRVLPARLRGKKKTGGKVELLLVERTAAEGEVWQVLCKGGQNQKAGGRVNFAARFWGKWVEAPRAGQGRMRFFPEEDFQRLVEQHGEVPLPPYIRRPPGRHAADRERYQTVYARHPGAVAAPTAGLHFTPALLDTLRQNGIQLCFVTLHVGLGTFQPVRVAQVEAHTMSAESYEIDHPTAARINEAKAAGRKIIAVGTTTTRALESAARQTGRVRPGPNRSDLFIYPGYEFRVIDGLITNFHLPRSTLLLLVSAFAGRERILRAYAEAVQRRYRFYSYGDAMLIL